MAATKTIAAAPNAYRALVTEFPLVHLRDESHLEEALALIDRLLAEDLDEGGQEYLAVLTDLVEAYENRHHAIPYASEANVLAYVMRERNLSQTELGKRTKIAPSTISSVLSGARNLTRGQIETLAAFFKVSPAVFLS